MNQFPTLPTALLMSMRALLGTRATIRRAGWDDANMALSMMDRQERKNLVASGFKAEEADAAVREQCELSAARQSDVFVLESPEGVKLALMGLNELAPFVNPWCLLSPAGAGRHKRLVLRALRHAVALLEQATKMDPRIAFIGTVTDQNTEAQNFLRRVGFEVSRGGTAFALYELRG